MQYCCKQLLTPNKQLVQSKKKTAEDHDHVTTLQHIAPGPLVHLAPLHHHSDVDLVDHAWRLDVAYWAGVACHCWPGTRFPEEVRALGHWRDGLVVGDTAV
jgi:hypothetical protein